MIRQFFKKHISKAKDWVTQQFSKTETQVQASTTIKVDASTAHVLADLLQKYRRMTRNVAGAFGLGLIVRGLFRPISNRMEITVWKENRHVLRTLKRYRIAKVR